MLPGCGGSCPCDTFAQFRSFAAFSFFDALSGTLDFALESDPRSLNESNTIVNSDLQKTEPSSTILLLFLIVLSVLLVRTSPDRGTSVRLSVILCGTPYGTLCGTGWGFRVCCYVRDLLSLFLQALNFLRKFGSTFLLVLP